MTSIVPITVTGEGMTGSGTTTCYFVSSPAFADFGPEMFPQAPFVPTLSLIRNPGNPPAQLKFGQTTITLDPACYSITYVNNGGTPPPSNTLNLEIVDTDGGTQDDSATLTSGSDPTRYVRWVSTQFLIDPCCVAGGSTVQTRQGLRTMDQLHAGQEVVDYKGNLQLVQSVKRFVVPSRQWILIKRGALGSDAPNADFYIRRDHPILVGGREVPPQELINGSSIIEVTTEQPHSVYTLCTNHRTFFLANNLPVASWGRHFDGDAANWIDQ